jgi:hypothetical protein
VIAKELNSKFTMDTQNEKELTKKVDEMLSKFKGSLV